MPKTVGRTIVCNKLLQREDCRTSLNFDWQRHGYEYHSSAWPIHKARARICTFVDFTPNRFLCLRRIFPPDKQKVPKIYWPEIPQCADSCCADWPSGGSQKGACAGGAVTPAWLATARLPPSGAARDRGRKKCKAHGGESAYSCHGMLLFITCGCAQKNNSPTSTERAIDHPIHTPPHARLIPRTQTPTHAPTQRSPSILLQVIIIIIIIIMIVMKIITIMIAYIIHNT